MSVIDTIANPFLLNYNEKTQNNVAISFRNVCFRLFYLGFQTFIMSDLLTDRGRGASYRQFTQMGEAQRHHVRCRYLD
jgi:hypothetical protein